MIQNRLFVNNFLKNTSFSLMDKHIICVIYGGTSGHMVELVIGVNSKSILFKNQFCNFKNVKKQELLKKKLLFRENVRFDLQIYSGTRWPHCFRFVTVHQSIMLWGPIPTVAV